MSELHHPPIQITDEHDHPLRGGTMDEVQLGGLWHRITGVMVQDVASGEFLLQKIAPNPYYGGGKWNLTATGHVDAGESYKEAALRELFEEMGVRRLQLTDFSYYQTEREDFRAGENRVYRRHNAIFIAQGDRLTMTITPHPDEVEDWAWMSLRQLQEGDVLKTQMLEQFVADYEQTHV